MNLQLDDIALFVRIVELGSLSAVARELNISVSQVTRALGRLESTCSTRLLHRTTHGLSLTDEGDNFLPHAQQMLAIRDVATGDFGGTKSTPSGWVRVSASAAIAQAVLAPSLPSLYDRFPQLRIDISADDRLCDLARDGIDIAIRAGAAGSDTLVVRELGRYQRSLYAAPSYAALHGLPKHVSELAQHQLIGSSVAPNLNEWFSSAKLKPHVRTDNSAMLLVLAQQGLGIARLMTTLAQPLVQRGELLPVLTDHLTEAPVPLYAVQLAERHKLPKIRACIDYWSDYMRSLETSQ
ncbi:LysR family transcriptional regulator [Curvibacter sp. CHRR-16]|uniref:LysR family transcriptional regulator n=1 Tax=Curvibacter sp. CHRR-16 TaxID=2835872 RepID=UPI001BDA2F8E|nr:LysR family transcriptional regulator [Curvibacter sp. CHRR-16]MBT0571010.1 LysR family transcriptional regulator [Curvibacter sp. CHRR-16]